MSISRWLVLFGVGVCLLATGGCPSATTGDAANGNGSSQDGGNDGGDGGNDDGGNNDGGGGSIDDGGGGSDTPGGRPSPDGVGIGDLADGGSGGTGDGGGAGGGGNGGDGSGVGNDGGSGGSGGSGSGGNDDPGDDDPQATMFAGKIERTTIELLNPDPNNPEPGNPRSRDFDLGQGFDLTGFPVELLVPGYSDSPDFTLTIVQAGETQTVQQTFGSRQVTVVATVVSAQYASNAAALEIALDYDATQGQLSQRGDGVCEIALTLSPDGRSIDYAGRTRYDVELVVTGGPRIPTVYDVTLEGSLSRQ